MNALLITQQQGTQHCSPHSFRHTSEQWVKKSSKHNWHSNRLQTQDCLCTSTASTYKTDHICHKAQLTTYNMSSQHVLRTSAAPSLLLLSTTLQITVLWVCLPMRLHSF